MGRPRNDLLPDEPAAGTAETTEPASSGFVLARNFGLQWHGKAHWWPAGHVFDPAHDKALIAALHQNGARFR